MCKEKEFGKYKGLYINSVEGSVEVGASAVYLNMNGQDTTKLCLSLGKLQTEYVDIPALMNDSKGRLEKNTLICISFYFHLIIMN